MAYEVTWLASDEHCIVIRPSGVWTWEEFQHTFAEAHAAAASKSYVVDYIADLATIRSAPGPNFLMGARHAYLTRPANAGLAVIVNPPMAVKIILDIVAKTLGKSGEFRFVHTMTDAVRVVDQARAARGEMAT
jgi:hypothetical protein